MAKLIKVAIEEASGSEVMSEIIDDDGIDLSKDRTAIEEISGQLDTALKMQADLTEKLKENNNIETPTETDIASTEVAIESALIRLGVSREEYGLHTKSTRSFSVSQEGIVEIIKNIGRTIMNLVNKIIIFFKKLFNKIKLKFGNYKSKIQEMRKKLQRIASDNKRAIKDRTNCMNAYSDIENLNLVNCALYAPPSSGGSTDIPKFHTASIAVCNKLTDWISDCVNDIINNKNNDWKESMRKIINNGNYNDAGIDNYSSSIIDDNFSVFYIGGTKNNMFYIEIDYFQEDCEYPVIMTQQDDISIRDIVGGMIQDPIRSSKWAPFNGGLFKSLTARILKYKSETYDEIFSYMEQYAVGISRLVDDGSPLFDEIAKIQKKLADLTTKISKNAAKVSEDDNKAAIKMSHMAKNVKVVAADICGSVSKAYFSTIRDYLVIGNVLIKHFG